MAQISHEIGKRIRAFRKARHMTLDELAQILCKNKSTLSKYETGEIVLDIETIYEISRALGIHVEQLLQSALDSELQFLQQLCGLTLDELFQTAYSEQAQRPELAFLPRWQTCELDLAAAYAQRMSEVGKKGYGMFAKHHVFTVENGQLVPVKGLDAAC